MEMFLHHLNVIGVLHLWVSQSNLSIGEQRKKSLKKKGREMFSKKESQSSQS